MKNKLFLLGYLYRKMLTTNRILTGSIWLVTGLKGEKGLIALFFIVIKVFFAGCQYILFYKDSPLVYFYANLQMKFNNYFIAVGVIDILVSLIIIIHT